MGKIIVDVLATEVNEKELNAKSKASLVVGNIPLKTKKAIDSKEEEMQKFVSANSDKIDNVSIDSKGNIDIDYKVDDEKDKEIEEKNNENPQIDEADELII